MATWPSSLPDPVRTGYTIKRNTQVIRTDMETGIPRQRRRFTAPLDVIAVTWIFSDSEFTTFENFVNNDINGGADWFDCDLKDGQGVRTMEVRFMGGTYEAKLVGMDWQVDAHLEVRNR